ncbi:imidazoleglycerol-phosphate dehydratase HisB [Ferroplasma sp.]|uniref:imidazoleglycerol-phosphate dehydratase HisB n=1 Tax=Ferroplasma sp. TaxID=2591003 RepID=UPI00261C6263|nr:imidazoleglycerol-phosphate dehydratase HisB [Ferroplasma sp.]MCL4452635.1 imidazoleglycerol-phosphate dehydratase HisB [Candidatus Thermoplasmatota archaeon]
MIRITNETEIEVSLGSAETTIETGDPILDHMMKTLFFYMEKTVTIRCKYDLRHHLWEDLGITVAQEISSYTGKKHIRRFGNATMPMDESLVMVSLDISRAYINFDVNFTDSEGFEIGLVYEFLWALARTVPLTLHVVMMYGKNAHHITENIFKSLGTAMGTAIQENQYLKSTKGTI